MKSLIGLSEGILADASMWCATDTRRDYLTIVRRTENEGLSFLTITLPNFCQAFERSLAEGRICHSYFSGFSPKGRRGAFPAFLSGLLTNVFDSGTGIILSDPCPNSVFYIRQICLMFKKILLPCTPLRERRAVDQYVQTDNDVEKWDVRNPAIRRAADSLFETFKCLYSKTLDQMESLCYAKELAGNHGPGVTTNRHSPNGKWLFGDIPESIEDVMPLCDNFVVNASFISDIDVLNIVPEERRSPVRVALVPKTQKSPRIIAIESTAVQFAQQALLKELVPSLEGPGSLSRGHLNFTDQTVNQRMASLASKSGRHATLDLSEASDRVPYDLVKFLFCTWPHLMRFLSATRTPTSLLPDGRVISLKKYASMGSALCFPIEAMIFHSISVWAVQTHDGYRSGRLSAVRAQRDVYTYGDDIIIPMRAVEHVKAALSVFNLKVNPRKSFVTGKFRESCGEDAFDGIRVTPAYLRRIPHDMTDANVLASSVAFANHLYEKGCWCTARVMRSMLPKHIPHVLETSPLIGYHSFLRNFSIGRWCTHTHTWLMKGIRVVASKEDDRISDQASLLKVLSPRYVMSEDPGHLVRSVRRNGVRTKRCWAPPY
jgi:hypothetical protein